MTEYLRVDKGTKEDRKLKFIYKAIGKDDDRLFVTFCLVEKNKIISTNGSRLHIVKFEHDLKPGLYNLDIGKIASILTLDDYPKEKYANYERIVDQCSGHPSIGTFNFMCRNIYDNSSSICELILQTNKVFGFRYIKDLCGYEWEVSSDDKNHLGVRFISGDLEAIIMPMNRDQ